MWFWITAVRAVDPCPSPQFDHALSSGKSSLVSTCVTSSALCCVLEIKLMSSTKPNSLSTLDLQQASIFPEEEIRHVWPVLHKYILIVVANMPSL